MAKTILCTPVGLQSPEGVVRVNAAFSELEKHNRLVAESAAAFIAAWDELEDCEDIDEIAELRKALDARELAQDELLRAVAGSPVRGAA